MDRSLNKPLVFAMIAVALVLGLLLGISTGIADRLFGGPSPKTRFRRRRGRAGRERARLPPGVGRARSLALLRGGLRTGAILTLVLGTITLGT